MRARYFEATERPELAERDFTHLTTLDESSAAGFALLGSFYQRCHRIDEAITTWQAGLEVDPDHVGLQRLLLKALVISPQPQNRQRGRAMLDDLLKRLPDDADLLSVRAAVLLHEGTPVAIRQAREVLQRVVQLNPGNVIAYLRLIALAGHEGDLEQATELINQALRANPGSADLRLAQARLELLLDHAGLAREHAQSVLDSNPKNVDALNLLVELALRVADVDTAQRLNHEVLELDPTNEVAQLARAKIYRQQGDLGSAELRLAEAAQSAPGDQSVFLERLRLLGSQKRFDDILPAITERRDGHGDEIPVVLMGGWLLAATEADDYMHLAKSLFEQVIRLDPDHVEGLLRMAQVAYGLDELDASEQAYRRILVQEPYHRQSLNDLAWILGVERGKPDEALELAERGVARYPDDMHLLDTRGVLLTSLGRLE
ncbi:MAG: tetratricopeptide repeat protein, partial [Planctomycetota bacterium]